MRYPHILAALASEIWAMQPEKLLAIIDLMAMQADGVKFGAEEIEARIAPQTASAIARKEGAVAIVPLRGIISPRVSLTPNSSTGGGATAEGFSNMIDQMAGDDGVKAIVVDADTPGGNVLMVDEAAASIAAATERKPVIVQVNGNLASAGYWIGAAGSEIVMSPSAQAGAIGVRTAYDDVTAALEKQGVAREIISAGKYKGEGLLGPLSDEARAHTQSMVDGYYSMFVDRVAKGRNVSTDAVRNGFGQGRMVRAADAVREGMADRIATMNQTLARFGAGPEAPRQKKFAAQREKRALALRG